ncbi:hypothetical protein EJ04DRAFT_453268 [Polyplosphaeria fusca]|uniref:Retroviral polymerase SH3-like domain-containing protein n=1 Tax=Polyplosphaeria fusca TaxID=682080 RepID=A0A9P4QFS8_9PLEO|nr:hypothetical protein EJ04DRAFT_453268 [Polyplosphaeria fusca]
MRLEAKLPKNLTNELCLTAVYLLNRTPIEGLDWKTPYEVARGVKPSFAHLSVIGAKALFRNLNIARRDKLESRAITGWLVGYEGTNIFRVWVPTARAVVRTRDVVFLQGKRFSKPEASDREVRRIVQVLDIDSDAELEDEAAEQLQREAEASLSLLPTNHQPEQTATVNGTGSNEAEKQLQLEAMRQTTSGTILLTPRETPELRDSSMSPETTNTQMPQIEDEVDDLINSIKDPP